MDFEDLTELKEEIDAFRPFSPEIMSHIDQKFKIEWTYHSNAIEGNTMTLQETTFFLQEGLTSKGKTLKEYLETQNHAEAIEMLKMTINNDRPITESFIKELHALTLKGIDYIWVGPRENRVQKRIYPGSYKTEPNHVLTLDGSIHRYTEPIKVPDEMERLISFIQVQESEYHPVEHAARAHHHFVAIHPFTDGNGRVGRLLMNLLVMRSGYPPLVIKNENRQEYYQALMEADNGDLTKLLQICQEQMEQSLQTMFTVIRETKRS